LGRQDLDRWRQAGGAPAGDRRVLGVIFGGALLPLLEERTSLARQSSLREWREWVEVVEDDPSLNAEIGESCTSSPEAAIRHLYASRGWIPLIEVLSCVGLGVDLAPGPDGAAGQVINIGRDARDKFVLAGSWAQFLEDVADELEADNFTLVDDQGDRAFRLARPVPGLIDLNLRAWSESKRAGRPLA
jgi:hypothetical protein